MHRQAGRFWYKTYIFSGFSVEVEWQVTMRSLRHQMDASTLSFMTACMLRVSCKNQGVDGHWDTCAAVALSYICAGE